jgi:hypothetical protein
VAGFPVQTVTGDALGATGLVAFKVVDANTGPQLDNWSLTETVYVPAELTVIDVPVEPL